MGDAFVAAVGFVIDELEGGEQLVNAPSDRGGLTKFGIAQRFHPDIDVANLTRGRAITVYHERYWKPCRADEFPEPLSLLWFAAYVNMSPGSAVRCLQRALRGLTVDGILGPRTLTAVRSRRGGDRAAVAELCSDFSTECLKHHYQDTREHPPQVANLNGWFRRICRATYEAGAWSVRS